MARGSLRGRRRGLVTSAGTVGGLLVHTVAAALGLSAVLRAPAAALAVVEVAGAGYLCWLGARAVWSTGTTHTHQVRRAGRVGGGVQVEGAALQRPRLPIALAFRNGLLTNVLNPGAPPISLSVLPQSVPPGAAVLARTVLLVLSVRLALERRPVPA